MRSSYQSRLLVSAAFTGLLCFGIGTSQSLADENSVFIQQIDGSGLNLSISQRGAGNRVGGVDSQGTIDTTNATRGTFRGNNVRANIQQQGTNQKVGVRLERSASSDATVGINLDVQQNGGGSNNNAAVVVGSATSAAGNINITIEQASAASQVVSNSTAGVLVSEGSANITVNAMLGSYGTVNAGITGSDNNLQLRSVGSTTSAVVSGAGNRIQVVNASQDPNTQSMEIGVSNDDNTVLVNTGQIAQVTPTYRTADEIRAAEKRDGVLDHRIEVNGINNVVSIDTGNLGLKRTTTADNPELTNQAGSPAFLWGTYNSGTPIRVEGNDNKVAINIGTAAGVLGDIKTLLNVTGNSNELSITGTINSSGDLTINARQDSLGGSNTAKLDLGSVAGGSRVDLLQLSNSQASNSYNAIFAGGSSPVKVQIEQRAPGR